MSKNHFLTYVKGIIVLILEICSEQILKNLFMKKLLFSASFLLIVASISSQTKNHKFGFTVGTHIQQYNGNLGNSFFKFNTVCFAGVNTSFSYYLNKSFDASIGASIGDFGYCQTAADANRIIALEDRCPGCKDRLGMGELRSRMIAGNIALRYKFNNGFILKENSKISPYVYLGVGINHLGDIMKRECVSVGYHFSVNGGVGIKYNINERLNVGINLGFGCFTNDKAYLTTEDPDDDKKVAGKKDMYLQNSFFIGINLF